MFEKGLERIILVYSDNVSVLKFTKFDGKPGKRLHWGNVVTMRFDIHTSQSFYNKQTYGILDLVRYGFLGYNSLN